MKSFNILFLFLVLFLACKEQNKKIEIKNESNITVDLSSYGQQINEIGAIGSGEMLKEYQKLTMEDTITTKFSATVKDVCKAKGCWMKLKLDDGQETMVQFKDYGFFVPKDIIGKKVVVNGLAFVEEMSVEDQKHYALDAGKSEEEIAKIMEPKKSYSFEADGVLIKQ